MYPQAALWFAKHGINMYIIQIKKNSNTPSTTATEAEIGL